MKLSFGLKSGFKGQQPLIAPRVLPDSMATTALNCKLTTDDLESYEDIGNPFQLAKSAPINTIWLMDEAFWLQFSQSEVAYGTNIDLSLGTVPGDTSFRTFLTGLAGGPRFTNLYYATDPSQGSGGAYPYVTWPLGVANPASAPTAVAAAAPPATVDTYEFAQQTFVNAITAITNAGSGYTVGQILSGNQGTLGLAGLPWTAKVNNIVAATGAIDTSISGAITLLTGGFYVGGAGPPTTGATVTTGGAIFNLNVANIQGAMNAPPPGWGFQAYNNNNGSFGIFNISGFQWLLDTEQGSTYPIYTTQSFGLRTAQAFTLQVDVQAQINSNGDAPDIALEFAGTFNNQAPFGVVAGPAVVLSTKSSKFELLSNIVANSAVDTVNQTVPGNTSYRIAVKGVQALTSSQPGYTITATYALASAPTSILGTVSGFVPYNGEQIGLDHIYNSNGSVPQHTLWGQFLLQVTTPVSGISQEATNYVTVLVQQFNADATHTFTDDSGPSDPSNTVTVYLNENTTPATFGPVTLTIPAVPAGENIAFVDIYRAVNLGGATEQYQFVDEIPALTAGPMTYIDTKLDEALGSALVSQTWQPPPANLQGILALPNGIMAGFFANTLCLSAQNFPQAWPVDNQYTTAGDIVAIAGYGTAVLVLTVSFPYTAYGSDPGNFAMAKETTAQGCIAKRSVATHRSYGVVYATPEGPAYYRGAGSMDLMRHRDGLGVLRPIFTIEQWTALNPSSMIGAVYDDYYYLWYTTTAGVKGGMVIDLNPDGFGKIDIDVHVTSDFVDPQTGYLYFTVDFSTLPVNGTVVFAPQNIVNQWEGAGPGSLRSKTWGRADNLLSYPVTFMQARLLAEDYTNISLTITNENGTAFTGAVTDENPFNLAALPPGRRWAVSMTGTSTVNRLEVVTQDEEYAEAA